MRNTIAALGLLLTSIITIPASAEVLNLSEPVTSSQDLPAKGAAQSQVLKHYGEPSKRYAPVGGGSAVQPPITRWDYPTFSVFFEHAHVIHAVVPGQPAKLYNIEQLKTSSN